jgi:hypothetical protein
MHLEIFDWLERKSRITAAFVRINSPLQFHSYALLNLNRDALRNLATFSRIVADAGFGNWRSLR